MSVSRSVSYAVPCPHCSKTTAKTIAYLTVHNRMSCRACGGLIKLESGDVATAIHEFEETCARLDASGTKRL